VGYWCGVGNGVGMGRVRGGTTEGSVSRERGRMRNWGTGGCLPMNPYPYIQLE
jgi:hypothetical protein